MLSSTNGFSSQAPLQPVSYFQTTTSNMEASTSTGSGVSNIPFPVKLRAMLEESEAKGLSHIVSWEMEGTAFRVHDPEEFVKQIMGQWFNQTKYKSFQRQLNLYGFNRVSRGPQKGCYIHEKFHRDQPEWAESICRKKVSDEDFTEAELIAPAWLPDATRSVLEPTPIRDSQPKPMMMMEAFESFFQTNVLKVSSRPLATSSKNPIVAESSSKGGGNALQRFLDKVLETDASENKPHAIAQDDETDTKDETTNNNATANFFHKRTSRCAVFPDKLHDMLGYCETNGLTRVCCWEMDGRAFRIRSIDLFTEQVMPKFFKLTKFESLQRQLNLYSFTRIARGPMKGCYYHPLFVRGGRDLSKDMQRRKPDDCAMSSIVSPPDVSKSLSKKRPMSISDSENGQSQEQESSSSSPPRKNTMPFETSAGTCGSTVVNTSDNELDLMARDCFGSQSNPGVSMFPSGSPFHLQYSNNNNNAMAMGRTGISRLPVSIPAVSPQGMVLSGGGGGWDPSVFTGNHTSMHFGDDIFSLAPPASL